MKRLFLALAILALPTAARADEAPETAHADKAPETAHARTLVIEPHASPTVGGDGPAQVLEDTHAAKRVECPQGWTLEAGVCLP